MGGDPNIRIITPKSPDERGCQLSIQVKNADKSLHQCINRSRGVVTDWREPDVIRCAPVPLYNSYEDVYRLVERLKPILTFPMERLRTKHLIAIIYQVKRTSSLLEKI